MGSYESFFRTVFVVFVQLVLNMDLKRSNDLDSLKAAGLRLSVLIAAIRGIQAVGIRCREARSIEKIFAEAS